MHNNRDRRKSTYRLTSEPATVQRDDGAFVSVASAEYTDWLASGNAPEPIENPNAG